jgi:hypothetical protein
MTYAPKAVGYEYKGAGWPRFLEPREPAGQPAKCLVCDVGAWVYGCPACGRKAAKRSG